MGTINYRTSDFITMGLRPYDESDFENDRDFMEELQRQIDEYGGTIENALQDYINTCYEEDYINIETELKKHAFYYFHVAIEPGYYEGFSLDIENNFPIAFDYWQDKRDAQKEISELRQFLKDCAGLGLVACSLWWCTKYYDYKETLKQIDAAIKSMREVVKRTPTWRMYEREQG